jgi:diacylglycerol kinase family enzyme
VDRFAPRHEGPVVTQPDICVIFNPRAGRGNAPRRLERLRHRLRDRAEFWPTQKPGAGEELARTAAQAGFRIVAAAGGDGTVHEVANGLLRAGTDRTALAVLPIGSANDYAYSLQASPGREVAAGIRRVDVGVVQAPDGRLRYFINGLGLGFNGAVTLESRRIHRLQGLPLYTLALLRALCFRYNSPMMEVLMDDACRRGPTLALTVNLGRREGGFLLTPEAELDDGQFDYLHAGPMRRWQLLRYLPRMMTGRLPRDHPAIWLGRCRRVSIRSEAPLTVHTDGEFFSRPEDGVKAIDIRLLPRGLSVSTELLPREEKNTEPRP